MSPEVWSEVRAVIEAAALDINTGDSPAVLAVEWPNEFFEPPEPIQAWVSIDISGDAAEAVELGRNTWLELGAVWIHVMMPIGSGIEDGLKWRKQFATQFRASVSALEGLVYTECAYDPLGAEDGVWRRLSLIQRYQFQDRLV